MGFWKVLAGIGAGIGAVVAAPVVLPALAATGAAAAAAAGTAAATVGATAAAAGATVATAAGTAAAAVDTAATAAGAAAATAAGTAAATVGTAAAGVGSAIAGGATAASAAAAGAVSAAGTALTSTAVGGAAAAAMETIGTGIGAAAGALSSAPVIGGAASEVAAMAGTSAGATTLGTIATTGTVGAVNTVSGAVKLSEARDIHDEAMRKYNAAHKKFEEREQKVNDALKTLDKVRLSAMSSFERFQTAYSKINNKSNLKAINVDSELLSITPRDLEDLKVVAISAKSILSGISVGGAATLALGQIAFGPALMVGGIMLNHKAKQAVENAEENLRQAERAAEKMQKIEAEFNKLEKVIVCVQTELQEELQNYNILVGKLETLVARCSDGAQYTEADGATITRPYLMLQCMRMLIKLKLFEVDQEDIAVQEQKTYDALAQVKTMQEGKLQYA